jgi:hypothetical protein
MFIDAEKLWKKLTKEQQMGRNITKQKANERYLQRTE